MITEDSIRQLENAAQGFLAGEFSAIETCWILDVQLHDNRGLLILEDRNFFAGVSSETDALPIGNLKHNWHPDFLPAKLEEIQRYESKITDRTKLICERLLAATEAWKKEILSK